MTTFDMSQLKSEVDHLRPKGKAILSLSALPITQDTVVTVKADGEFWVIYYRAAEQTYAVNRWGKGRWKIPVLNELVTAMKSQPSIYAAKILAEAYALDAAGRMLKLPDLIHYLRGEVWSIVRLGIIDVAEINGKPVMPRSYWWRLAELQQWFEGRVLIHVLPHMKPKTTADVEEFWKMWVEEKGYEGLVVRDNSAIWKVKKHATIDAVLIGLNKTSTRGPNLYSQGQVTSIKVALMTADGNYLDISDVASGIDIPLRRKLYELSSLKVNEDRDTVYLKPFICVEVEFTETLTADRPILKLEADGYRHIGTMPLYSLRHPRLLRFRTDKTPTPETISIQQVEG